MNEEEKPIDPALHALWVIRNWTRLPKGNLETYEHIVRKVNTYASEMYALLNEEELK